MTTRSYAEAVAEVTGPGSRYEITTTTVGGINQMVFAHAPESLAAIWEAARGHGEATFIVYEDERLTFAETFARADALAGSLVADHGVGSGDRVAIAMRNYPEWVIAFIAATSVGAVSVSLNAWWTTDEIDFALGDCTPKVLVADAERTERSRGPAERHGVATIGVRLGEGPVPEGVVRYEDALAAGHPKPAVPVSADDDATILYTSGTTGRPKGAVSTHRAVVHALMGFGARTAIDRSRDPEAGGARGEALSFILIVPLFHVTGCVPVLLSCIASGLKLVMMYRWDPERALELIERERITNFVGVPTQSWDLLEHPRFDDFDTSSLLRVGGGGAPAPAKLVGRVAETFQRARPNIGYGMTETNAYGPANSGADYTERPTSTGRAAPPLQVEVRSADGAPVPTGADGEIWMKGPNVIRGYWNRPEATAETIVDGWLNSGDLGHLDDEGFLYVGDRAKDMILRGGENVYSVEIEDAVYDHPGIAEAAVFGLPHERLGEEVALAVVPAGNATWEVEELRSFLGERLASFKVPSQVWVRSELLPRNAAGKILKKDLRDVYAPADEAAS